MYQFHAFHQDSRCGIPFIADSTDAALDHVADNLADAPGIWQVYSGDSQVGYVEIPPSTRLIIA